MLCPLSWELTDVYESWEDQLWEGWWKVSSDRVRHLRISVKIVICHYGMISSQLSQLSGSRCSRWIQQDQPDTLDRVAVSSNEIVDIKVLPKSHISLNTNHV